MKTKIVPNPDEKKYKEVSRMVELNCGYCPCLIERSEKTKCMCESFRHSYELGECHCGRFVRVEVKE